MSHHEQDLEELMSHGHWIQELALQLVHDPHSADDLVQETWLAALNRPHGHGPTRGWLVTVLRNFARQRGRREGSLRRRENISATPERLPSSSELLERAETQRILVESVMALNDPYRSTLLTHFYEGLSSAEIARRRGISDSTVRAQLRRGLERLRTRLDRQHPGGRTAWSLALGPLLGSAHHAAVPLPVSSKLGAAVGAVSATALVTVTVLAFLPDRPQPAQNGLVAAHTSQDGALKPTPRARATEAPVSAITEVRSPARKPLTRQLEPSTTEATTTDASRTRVSGTILDNETMLPVPDYSLFIYDNADEPTWELLETDKNGNFESARTWPAGPLNARLIDDEQRQTGTEIKSWIHREDGPSELTLLARVGPTYLLDFDLPDDLSGTDFVAMIAQAGRSLQGDADSPGLAAPVRAGSPAWVRFAPIAVANIGAGPPWELDVVSRDGLHSGSTSVHRRSGIGPEVHTIELEDRGSVRGWILDEHGRPVPNSGIALIRDDETNPLWILSRADIQGGYNFRALPPGDYTLHTMPAGHQLAKVQVNIELLTQREVDLVVGQSPVTAPITGLVRSETGTYRGPVTMRMRASYQPVHASHVRWAEEDGALVGRFSFDRLPQLPWGKRTYDLWTQREDLFRWDGDSREVAPGVTGVELLVHDDVPTYALGFRVVEDLSGAQLSGVPVQFGVQDGVAGMGHGNHVDFGDILLPAVPLDIELYWTVRAPGYIPVFGTSVDLESDGDRRFASVRLRPGWGARFYLVSEQPVEGAHLIFDGKEYGVIGHEAYVDVTLPGRPERVSVEAHGWVLESSTQITEDGLFDDTYWSGIRLQMHRTGP